MWFALLVASSIGSLVSEGDLALNPELPLTSCVRGGDVVHVGPNTNTTVEGTLAGTIETNTHIPNEVWCSGYVPLEPQHCFVVSSPLTLVLEVIDASGIDSVLAMQDEQDEFVSCDDDGGANLLSRLEVRLDAGSYRVSVGSFGAAAEGTYRMTVRTR